VTRDADAATSVQGDDAAYVGRVFVGITGALEFFVPTLVLLPVVPEDATTGADSPSRLGHRLRLFGQPGSGDLKAHSSARLSPWRARLHAAG